MAQSSDHSACSKSISGSSSTPQGVILTPSEYEEYLRLTQAAKSSSIASVAQTGNVSTCLTHSSAPWILDTGASNHISGNKDIFSSLTFPSPLPTITLANGSQTIAKGIGSACPLPSLPLTSVLYVPNFPFNLIFISKLTRDLHCVLTFSHNSVTLQDRVRGRRLASDMCHKASFTSARLFVPLLALLRKLLSSFTVVSVIQASPSFGSWFLFFLVYLRLSVSLVSLGNIFVSYSQSV